MSAAQSSGTMTAVWILLVAALFCWLLLIPGLLTYGGSDAAGNALAAAFDALLTVVLWGLLAVLVLLAGQKGEMPATGALAALILIPASGAAALAAERLLRNRAVAPFVWPILVPALVPPLVAAFALWVLLPSLRAAVPPTWALGVIWGPVLLVSLAILPMLQARDLTVQKREDRRVAQDLGFAQLPPDSPMWEGVPRDAWISPHAPIRRILSMGPSAAVPSRRSISAKIAHV